LIFSSNCFFNVKYLAFSILVVDVESVMIISTSCNYLFSIFFNHSYYIFQESIVFYCKLKYFALDFHPISFF
ncbi:hypothetical protein C1646_724140, partial [Rhizophagus diaphanus]